MNTKTEPTKLSDIKRSWHLIDLKGKILGRISTEIALLLMGKRKPYFVRHLDCGDFVVATNAKHVAVSGKKETSKKYYRHSGYPHGLKVETLSSLRQKNPEDIIYHAVKGMLPDNRLKALMLKRFFVFAEEEHPYHNNFKSQISNLKNKK